VGSHKILDMLPDNNGLLALFQTSRGIQSHTLNHLITLRPRQCLLRGLQHINRKLNLVNRSGRISNIPITLPRTARIPRIRDNLSTFNRPVKVNNHIKSPAQFQIEPLP
jgi:hypothetical protein